jgi:hypothetical protein
MMGEDWRVVVSEDTCVMPDCWEPVRTRPADVEGVEGVWFVCEEHSLAIEADMLEDDLIEVTPEDLPEGMASAIASALRDVGIDIESDE